MRKTARELGITIGRFPTGQYNAITDIKGVEVGHITHIQDDVPVPGSIEKSCIRTGVTAVLPSGGNIYDRRLVAGGFVLNGIGEMTGLTQVMEWGWIETPILLTNTMSIGTVHSGIVDYMMKKYKLGAKSEVIIPVIGETDDSFLNDVRIPSIKGSDVADAIIRAKPGLVEQGAVGAGTGMTTLDCAGGIGTSSRVLPEDSGGYKIGVLVLSNFGNMVNLTIDGAVIGRELDQMFDRYLRRMYNYGSIIVVIATDAPLMSTQLSKIAKRAALGVGRAGSFASSTSGEIMIAFSTGNRIKREQYGMRKMNRIKFLSQSHINPLYEAVIEATEEAVLNAMFCSEGISGREGRRSPAIPVDKVMRLLGKRREVRLA